jgi:hypothetical protein
MVFCKFKIMKYILILFSVLFAFSCKAQTTIVPLNNAYVGIPPNAYFKDTNNDYYKFIGTWKFTQGNESFTLVLDESIHEIMRGYFKDILYGEYEYIDATGTTLINTLPLMSANYTNQLSHNIAGGTFKGQMEFPKCLDCTPTEIRIKVIFTDPERRYIPMEMTLRSVSPTQIKVKLYQSGQKLTFMDDPFYDEIRVPSGEYIMNKI